MHWHTLTTVHNFLSTGSWYSFISELKWNFDQNKIKKKRKKLNRGFQLINLIRLFQKWMVRRYSFSIFVLKTKIWATTQIYGKLDWVKMLFGFIHLRRMTLLVLINGDGLTFNSKILESIDVTSRFSYNDLNLRCIKCYKLQNWSKDSNDK